MTLKPYSQKFIDYLHKSGMNYGITPDSIWFNMNRHHVTMHRLSARRWVLTYFFHTYYFYSQLELIEWIEDQRRQGK
jgi:hypothetical protein